MRRVATLRQLFQEHEQNNVIPFPELLDQSLGMQFIQLFVSEGRLYLREEDGEVQICIYPE
jgi:hypothetical protein